MQTVRDPLMPDEMQRRPMLPDQSMAGIPWCLNWYECYHRTTSTECTMFEYSMKIKAKTHIEQTANKKRLFSWGPDGWQWETATMLEKKTKRFLPNDKDIIIDAYTCLNTFTQREENAQYTWNKFNSMIQSLICLRSCMYIKRNKQICIWHVFVCALSFMLMLSSCIQKSKMIPKQFRLCAKEKIQNAHQRRK